MHSVNVRGGERETRFPRHVRNTVLPVQHEGQILILAWGCQAGTLPRSGNTWLTTVEAGEWTVYGAEEVIIPATAGIRNGIWFPVRQGIRGLIAEAGGRDSGLYARRALDPLLPDHDAVGADAGAGRRADLGLRTRRWKRTTFGRDRALFAATQAAESLWVLPPFSHV